MTYKVIPFVARVSINDGAGVAATQLALLINEQSGEGWEYVRLENIELHVTDPGNSGCFGINATPPSTVVTRYDMAVFRK